ncbi:uncharacterized protein CIMG_02469 [Coccidioides immitis RS]|uniref:Hypervirulence associated protein TUDOR domain-containing protein n=7 Tax=Coccidioides TaxID=5500 RepID=J3KLG1_COCIM|nr:uncharacterized protein CIMG_02469 [Coccidioides immitis RS]XP_003070972.1 hypothetical protein CPC735_040910 [Coccidioides posadasii C735 delta SOWgp]EFW22431.1 conserved hypothetical protein [Coccidioides posadasii str. Silveira]KMM64026.1 hypothetical protein CPAG_00378 [Coccidioides posadasii RMSCC 3488]KMP10056.1 hypothetical protein CIRG_09289 [Coccidioides immitis RMSCC 2394]KMU81046.1 hypothetical protein CISG_02425 [Coccidioides immitis RMSCC 3703]KMU86567.1 hypothetical protein C|eukprot:XP_003070972.1 hypothetical protein CPC735_040910 [Coccidioides posadasii C735 delta SOWgp]
MSDQVKDKTGEPIHEGDDVETRIRGGTRKGTVENIVTSQEEAREENVKNPPKVVYYDQHGHRVAHNPQTLRKGGED